MIQLVRLELTTVVNITYFFEPFCKLLKHNNSHLVAEVLTFQFFDGMLSGGNTTQGNLPLMLQLFAPQILIKPHSNHILLSLCLPDVAPTQQHPQLVVLPTMAQPLQYIFTLLLGIN